MANGNITFPEVINNFNVYNSGNKMVGVSGEISLADLQAVTAEVSGAGIMGSYNTAVVGMFQSISQEIPFRMVKCDTKSRNKLLIISYPIHLG